MFKNTKHDLPFNGVRRRPIERSISMVAGKNKVTLAPSASNHSIVGSLAPQSLAADAKAFLFDLAPSDRDQANAVAWFKGVATVIRRSSRSRHVRAVAAAHAIALQLDDHADRELILEDLQRLVGRKIAGRVRDLHLIVEHVVGYGADNAADLAAARRLISRDVKAIEHLRKKEIPPSRVEALARGKGEGLNQWSRRAAIPKRKTEKLKAEALSPQQEEHERSLRHVLLHVVRDADGAEIDRDKIVLTAVLVREVEAAFARLRKLELALTDSAIT